MAIRVLLADPHRMFRDGFRRLLEQTKDLELASDVGDGVEAARRLGTGGIDVGVLATRMPGLSDIDAVARIRDARLRPPCIALSPDESRRELERSLAGGMSGFVVKTSPAHELIDAIRVVHSGRCYVSPVVAGDLIGALDGSGSREHRALSGLTARQTEILALIAEGHSSREIASELRVPSSTVDTQRARLMKKLGVRKAAALVRLAVREGLVPT